MIYPRVSSYPEVKEVKLLGFAGYKAGMGHVVVLDNDKNSKTFGQKISVPVTVIDCPPLRVVGIRFYGEDEKGLKVLTEMWSEKLPKDLERKVKIKAKKVKEPEVKDVKKVRVIVCTQPRLSGLGKKKPEVFEIEIGGESVEEKIKVAKELLGKEVKVSEVFREGEYVDVVAVTKGKGTEGPVKRFGVKIQNRHAKEKRRHVGSLGQERPGRVRPTVPMAGQLGFQTRTELNKRIIKIGNGDITPPSGFLRYGVVKGDYILIEGSVPGPKKRLIRLRPSIRKREIKPVEVERVVI